jgi:hypothetical protein
MGDRERPSFRVLMAEILRPFGIILLVLAVPVLFAGALQLLRDLPVLGFPACLLLLGLFVLFITNRLRL